jgi:membrane-bound lytic murein transglycosylase D
MKYLCLFCLPVLLSGCALIPTENDSDIANNTAIGMSENDTHSALNIKACEFSSANSQATQHDAERCASYQEGVADLVHPEAPVDVPLPKKEPALPSEPDDVWQKIAQDLAFTIPSEQPRLDAQKNWYLKHPGYMSRVATRARPFLYYIVEQLEANDIPLDIALLPIVESAFDPFAYSSGRAAGMWQFIPSSGKRFGMPQNWWYDGRRDVVASTQGAIAYLKYLNNMFDGNWMHALAAYNSGEGRVARAIRKNEKLGKSTDFWSLDLPRETRAYVPKLLALADILKNSDTYNFDWPAIDNAQVIDVVDVGSQIDLAMAAQMSGLNLAELQALNPGFNKWATPPEGPHLLVLPLDKVESFTLALSNTPESERLNWERHKVKRGESIGLIAQRYNTNIDVIKRVNNMSNNTIYAGDNLLVPVALNELNDYALNVAQNSYHSARSTQNKVKIYHTVKSGDTLWDLSRAYDVSVRELSRWNRMSVNDPLKLGKRLVMYSPDTADKNEANTTRSLSYKVRSGDSLSLIASKFNVKVNDILRWNGLNKNKYLQPGQQLKLEIDMTKS